MIEAKLNGRRIEVTSPYDPNLVEFCHSMPNNKFTKIPNRIWRYDATPLSCKLTADSPLFDSVDDEIHKLAYEWRNMRASYDGANYLVDSLPWAHQLAAMQFCHFKYAAMLAMRMGTGKTKTAIDIVRNKGAKRILVICPKAVIDVWPFQFQQHAADLFKVVALKKGTSKKKANLLEGLLTASGDQPLVVVINYETAWRKDVAKVIESIEWDAVICDESQKIANAASKQSRFVCGLATRSKFRLCLSGTPMRNSPLDLFGQYKFLEPAFFGTRFASFRDEYAETGMFNEVRYLKNQEQLHERFLELAFECGDDVLDLPASTDTTIPIEIDGASMEVYSDLETEFVASLPEGGEVAAPNVLVKLLRCQQVTSGFVDDKSDIDDPIGKNTIILETEGQVEKRRTLLNDGKREALQELLEEIEPSERVVVFCLFRRDLEQIAQASERPTFELSGQSNDLEEWKETEGAVLAVQIQAGSTGIDLTVARYCVFFSVNHSLADYDQARARCQRPGQTRNVAFYHLVVEQTIDVKIREAFEQKRDLIDYILKGDREPCSSRSE